MKAWALGLLGLFLICSPTLSIEEPPEETSAGSNQEIRITLTHRVPEGVLFSRRTVEGVPIFAVSLFVNRTPYRTRILTRKAFTKYLHEFDRVFYDEGRARTASTPPCPRHLRRTVEVNRQERYSQALCLTAISRPGEQKLARWYEGIKALF